MIVEPGFDLIRFQGDRQLRWLFGGVLALLTVSTLAAKLLARHVHDEESWSTISNLQSRIRSWWIMSAIFGLTLLVGPLGSILLFASLSFLALREFFTLVPTRRTDHRSLFWIFFIITPLQYLLVARQWYGLFTILIPVYAFLFIPTRIAIGGDTEHFLERAAKIQWGLMVCVYSVSHAPALLMLRIPGFDRQNAKLLMFLVLVDQLSDVFQYVWGKLLGRRRIAPNVSPNKTWEGFALGGVTAILVGIGLWWATPFNPWQAGAMSLVIVLMGFAGGLVMSAIKRDRGIKDFSSLIEGHGGMLDRIDSVCFAAPVFFHLTRFVFGAGWWVAR
jgi:phosphatidate cytidylyltransferase